MQTKIADAVFMASAGPGVRTGVAILGRLTSCRLAAARVLQGLGLNTPIGIDTIQAKRPFDGSSRRRRTGEAQTRLNLT